MNDKDIKILEQAKALLSGYIADQTDAGGNEYKLLEKFEKVIEKIKWSIINN